LAYQPIHQIRCNFTEFILADKKKKFGGNLFRRKLRSNIDIVWGELYELI